MIPLKLFGSLLLLVNIKFLAGQQCSDTHLKVGLVLDGSPSISDSEWNEIRTYMIDLIKELYSLVNADGSTMQIGISQFDSNAFKVADCSDLSDDYAQYSAYINNLERQGFGISQLIDGATVAVNVLDNPSCAGNKNFEKKLVIVVTDGLDNEFSEANRARLLESIQDYNDLDVPTFIIGAGSDVTADLAKTEDQYSRITESTNALKNYLIYQNFGAAQSNLQADSSNMFQRLTNSICTRSSECTSNTDCASQFCNNGVCQCPSGSVRTSSATGGVTLQCTVGECSGFVACTAANTQCNTLSSTCVCRNGFVSVGGISNDCVSINTCTASNPCTGANTICLSGTCTCQSGFTQISGSGISLVCSAAAECNLNTDCASQFCNNGVCQCPSGSVRTSSATGGVTLQCTVGECSGFVACTAANTQCNTLSSTCVCRNGFVSVGGISNDCVSINTCTASNPCTGANTICLSGTCTCQSGFTQISGSGISLVCSAAAECNLNTDCASQFCNNGVCQCPSGSVRTSSATGGVTLQCTVGECSGFVACTVSNSQCNTASSTCACSSGFINTGGNSLNCVSGNTCFSTNPCTGANTFCLSGVCTCSEGFSLISGSGVNVVCGVEQCSASSSCTGSLTACNNGVCECQAGYVKISGSGIDLVCGSSGSTSCLNQKFFYIFAADTSSSVSPNGEIDEIAAQKNFLKGFLDQTGFRSNGKQDLVALINYGQTSQIEFGCTDVQTQAQFNERVDSMGRVQQSTNHIAALQHVLDLISTCGAPNFETYRPIVIFLTDGQENIQQDATLREQAFESLRNKFSATNAILFALAIDSTNPDGTAKWDTSEINSVATSTSGELFIYDDFVAIRDLNVQELVGNILDSVCESGGQWTGWVNVATCSVTCGGGTVRQRRQCRKLGVENGNIQKDCSLSGLSEEFQNVGCNTNDCQGTLSAWVTADCPFNCNNNGDINNGPSTIRTRLCQGSTGSGNCDGLPLTESIPCSTLIWNTGCIGSFSAWSAYSACSASCNTVITPTQFRTRTCQGDTLNAGCGIGSLIETKNCNENIGCPGAFQFLSLSACSETCQSGLDSPTQISTDICVANTPNGFCESAQFPHGSQRTKVIDCNSEVSCPPTFGVWSDYGVCSETCHKVLNLPPTQTRSRQCIGGTFGGVCTYTDVLGQVQTVFQNQFQTQSKSCNEQLGCPGVLSVWTAYSACSHTCFSNPNTPPTQSRTRTCTGDTFNAGCGGALLVETIPCNRNVGCEGGFQFIGLTACSATCQAEIDSPTQISSEQCFADTPLGFCETAEFPNGSVREKILDCNSEVPCPAAFIDWGVWSSCSASCHKVENQPPTQTRSRQCTGGTFGASCTYIDQSGQTQTVLNNQFQVQSRSCNVQIGCPGVLSVWTAYSACSHTCFSNPNTPPTQSRTRTCNGDTFNAGCGGALLVETIPCNRNVGCEGGFQFIGLTACSATCQAEIDSPTQISSERCFADTPLGFCETAEFPNGSVREKILDCNSEVPCPAAFIDWGVWSSCSASCHKVENQPPTQTRSRQCTGGTFGASCTYIDQSGQTQTVLNNQFQVQSRSCNVQIGCPGVLSVWTAYSACSHTCFSDANTPPTQSRTRTCNGDTFNAGCGVALLVETIPCNRNVGCEGQFQFSEVTACSETCQSGLNSPTQTSTDICVANTPLGFCESAQFPNGSSKTKVLDCNSEVSCPALFDDWSDWGQCSDTCKRGDVNPTQTRFRLCKGGSFGGSCTFFNSQNEMETFPNDQTQVETRNCNENVGCAGTLGGWLFVSDCPATCQLNENLPLRRLRRRACQGATLGENCNGAILEETVICNENVACPGDLSDWGDFTDCSKSCNEDNKPGTMSRIRACTNFSFDARCKNVELRETVSCNALVPCPVPGRWQPYGEWSECSKTCGDGMITRTRVCSTPFPATAGNECDDKLTEDQTESCSLQPCPVKFPVRKDCDCSNVPDLTIAPTLSSVIETNINTAIASMDYWTADIQKQICEDCRLLHLNKSLETVNTQIEFVQNLLQQIKNMKFGHRDMISCNQNCDITENLWKYYDYVWERCSMLDGVLTELKASKLRFDAAYKACQSYDWFHSLMTKMFRKTNDVKTMTS